VHVLRNTLRHTPLVKTFIKRVIHFLRGEPQVTYAVIDRKTLSELIPKSDPVILDIGCNDGREVALFMEAFERPRIFCFEPDPRAAKRFRNNYGMRENVLLYELAISSTDGETTFYQSTGSRGEDGESAMPEGWDLSGSIRKPTGHSEAIPGVSFRQSLQVKTARLDTWCKLHGIDEVDLLWMDVQGAEIDVFEGGRNSLAKTHYLYTEYSDTELYEGQLPLRELVHRLPDFDVLRRFPDDVLLKNKNIVYRT